LIGRTPQGPALAAAHRAAKPFGSPDASRPSTMHAHFRSRPILPVRLAASAVASACVLAMATPQGYAVHTASQPKGQPDSQTGTAEAPPARDALTLSLRALAAAERGSIDLDAKGITLVELFDQLQTKAALPLRIDWSALAGIGVAKDDRIDFHIRDVPPLAALKAIAAAMDAEFDRPVVDACSGQLVLTSPKGLADLRETAIYDIADILADPTMLEARAADDAATHEDDAPIDGAAVAVETPIDALADRLVEIISEHIDPEGWIDTGGSRGRITSEAGRLIVSATPATHRGLAAFLDSLRAQTPKRATIGWTIASMPTSQIDLLRERLVDGASALAVLRSIDGVVIESAPRATTLIGETATIEESGADRLTRCVARPSFDRIARSFGATVRVELRRGDRQASAEATLAGGPSGAVDIMQLASGPAEGRIWVVVVEAVAERPAPEAR
jgi:hypothetical protein